MRTSVLSRFNTLLLMLLVLMAASIIAILARGAIGGPLDPPGAPAPTSPQVEPRQPIPPVGWNGTFPIVLDQGSYYLTKSIIEVFGSAPAIDIQGSNVTFDLNGFFIRGVGTPAAGITSSTGASRVTVENGTVEGWQTGIDLQKVDNLDVHDVMAWNNSNDGIAAGPGAILSHVVATGNFIGVVVADPASKLEGALIEDSTMSGNSDAGFETTANGVTITRNIIENNANYGLTLNASRDVVTDNTVEGANICMVVGDVVNGNDTVARNTIGNCASTKIMSGNASNHIGPPTSDLTTSQPWSNVEY